MALAKSIIDGKPSELALLKRHESEKYFGVQVATGQPNILAKWESGGIEIFFESFVLFYEQRDAEILLLMSSLMSSLQVLYKQNVLYIPKFILQILLIHK